MSTKCSTKLVFVLAAGVLGATGVDAVVTAESNDITLDTRSQSRVSAVENSAFDTRSCTSDWSVVGKLDTRKWVGTVMLLR